MIDDYITSAFFIRKELDLEKKEVIENMHMQVTDRITFSFPLIHIDSYNVQSCIIPIEEGTETKYYNIIDHSMLDFCEWFLLALEYDQPNLAVAAYKELKRYICTVNSDIQGAEYYRLTKIYYTNYDMERENEKMLSGVQLSSKYEIMIKFHFLHEYGHYLIKNPVRDSSGAGSILDVFVEALFKDMEKKRDNNNQFSKKYNKILNKQKHKLLESYKHDYKENDQFKEEIMCDFQSLLCLLELSSIYSVNSILESIITYLYVQYAIWLAKKSEEEPRVGEILHFRINVMFEIAEFLTDEDIATALAYLINRENRYANVEKLLSSSIDYNKYHNFYNTLTKIILIDKNSRSKQKEKNKNNNCSNANPLDDIIFV